MVGGGTSGASGQDLGFTTDLVSALPFLGQVNLPTFCAFICNSLNGGICTHHLAVVPIRTQLNPSLGNGLSQRVLI